MRLRDRDDQADAVVKNPQSHGVTNCVGASVIDSPDQLTTLQRRGLCLE